MQKQFCVIFLIISVFCDSSLLMAQKLQSANECKACHKSVYAEWRESAHAHSSKLNNPLYRGMLKWAERTGDEKIFSSCQNCHEPAFMFQPEVSLDENIVQEGIGCDFCHSIQLDKKSKDLKFSVHKDGTKFGPLKDAVSGAHETAFSKDHSTSEFCLVCHSSSGTTNGIAFCDTEKEWNEFINVKTRIECQDCHMPSLEGRAATLGKIRDNIHSHDFWGGYSEKMLHTAVKLELSAGIRGNLVYVQIIATNRGAGHSVPTGSPMRYVVLEVVAKNSQGDIVWRNWSMNPFEEDPAAVFMRLLEDNEGKAPVPPWEALRERFDQRLRPDEPRRVVYSIQESDVSLIEAKLIYQTAPPALLTKLGIIETRYTEPRIMAEEIAVPQRLQEQ